MRVSRAFLLAVGLCCTLHVTAINVVRCDAPNHYECGKQLGTAMKAAIVDTANVDPEVNAVVNFTATHILGKAALAKLVIVNEIAFPEIMQEIRGIADGAGLPHDTLMSMNFAQELLEFVMKLGLGVGVPKSCTDYHVIDEGVNAWGHNEDYYPTFRKTAFLAKLNITKSKGSVVQVGFMYPGVVMGWAWGFNQHGLAQSGNALLPDPKTASKLGLAAALVARHVMEATSLEDAIKRACIAGQGTGQHFNLGALKTGYHYSVETSMKGCSVLEINSTSLYPHVEKPGRFIHVNLYERLPIAQPPENSSSHRLARISEMAPAQGPSQILEILSDTHDKEYPIYRNGMAPDDDVTLVTVLFDVLREDIKVYANKSDASAPRWQFDWADPHSWELS